MGVPFNIASYAILLMLIGHTVDMLPDKLIITFGDFHIYQNHIDQVKTLISRVPYKFPKLIIKKDIFNATEEDFELIDYVSHETIKADMAV